LEAGDTAKHALTEDDTTEHLGNDAWLVNLSETPCKDLAEDDDNEYLNDKERQGISRRERDGVATGQNAGAVNHDFLRSKEKRGIAEVD